MRLRLFPLVAVAAACAISARAADPPAAGSSAQAPIHGSDVMGDKGRSGPDGWSWAPQTRDQAPADKSAQAEADRRGDANSQPGPASGKTLKPGDDPGTPMATDSHGPGTMGSSAAHKP